MADFHALFGIEPEVHVNAHGRVNLLGEHTDYNDGFVLPTLIGPKTRVWAARSDNLTVHSVQFNETVTRTLEDSADMHWSDYVAGVWITLHEKDYPVRGARLLIDSTVPFSGGVSSSAALEIAVLRALRKLYTLDIDDVKLAQLAQLAENEFVGMRCGLMDQLVISAGLPDYASFIDIRSLDIENCQLNPRFVFKVVDSGMPRRLAEAGYNERRSECESACGLLNIASLRELTMNDMGTVNHLEDTLARRVRHVVTENHRVQLAADALKNNDMMTFGHLMDSSHLSLSEDYDVSIPELDELVQQCRTAGALGAKMTGAGFGGCVVALVPKSAEEEWGRALLETAPERVAIVV